MTSRTTKPGKLDFNTKQADALEAIIQNCRVRDSLEVLGDQQNSPKIPAWRIGGLPTLDRLLDGIYPDEFVCIHGSQGEGKTTFAMTLIEIFSRAGRVCYFHSLEETPRSIIRKYRNKPPAFYINTNMDYSVNYNLYPEELRPLIKDMLKHFPSERLKLLYLDILALKAQGCKPDFIFIDYFHKMLPTNIRPGADAFLLVAESLQTLVNTENICIIVINHDVKAAYEKKDSSLSDVRDSNWITATARIVMSIKRPKDSKGKPEGHSILKIEKHNRDGSVIGKQIKLVVNPHGLLSEAAREDANGSQNWYEREGEAYV